MTEEQIKDFIRSSKELLMQDNFQAVYDKLRLPEMNTKTLTEFFYDCGVDPLLYMNSVPSYFRNNDQIIDKVRIPYGIEYIGNYAFQNCVKLTDVYIPRSVRKIGHRCFLGCGSLKNVIFEEGSELESVGESAFYDCYSLRKVYIPDSVQILSSGAFENCESLQEANIPTAIQDIGIGVFYVCPKLSVITYGGRKDDLLQIFRRQQYYVTDVVHPFTIIRCSDGDIKA